MRNSKVYCCDAVFPVDRNPAKYVRAWKVPNLTSLRFNNFWLLIVAGNLVRFCFNYIGPSIIFHLKQSFVGFPNEKLQKSPKISSANSADVNPSTSTDYHLMLEWKKYHNSTNYKSIAFKMLSASSRSCNNRRQRIAYRDAKQQKSFVFIRLEIVSTSGNVKREKEFIRASIMVSKH